TAGSFVAQAVGGKSLTGGIASDGADGFRTHANNAADYWNSGVRALAGVLVGGKDV
ncbi:hypothetical protein HDU84_005759, partial [Entophlyctis sp. JEL0112]